MKWHESSLTFNKECANYPGFVTKFRVSNQVSAVYMLHFQSNSNDFNRTDFSLLSQFSEANDHVGYENYRHVCHKWHYKITKAMVFCLDSKDYMQIRNALLILMRILPHFPMLVKLAQIIERKVEKVREEEKNKRQDLFILASSYIGQLKAKSSDMIPEADFHQVAHKPNKEVAETVKPVNGSAPVAKEPVVEKKVKQIVAPVEKETKKERESNGKVQDQSVVVVDKKLSKELKREEKQREKEEKEIETRKRDRGEKRRERKTASPGATYYEVSTNDRYYTTDQYEQNDRERDRDLSSISNSSNGSTNRRQESPDHDRGTYDPHICTLRLLQRKTFFSFHLFTELKRRKVDSSLKKSLEDVPIILDETKKERVSKSKDRKEKSWDDGEVRKEKKVSRKRESKLAETN